mmetsp:Transcript_59753/g.159043  ORF Transcript_59753/g.159043 Transcript_59753/m.159043 type:complete len:255 (-) Transcript_59753:227-991(-)
MVSNIQNASSASKPSFRNTVAMCAMPCEYPTSVLYAATAVSTFRMVSSWPTRRKSSGVRRMSASIVLRTSSGKSVEDKLPYVRPLASTVARRSATRSHLGQQAKRYFKGMPFARSCSNWVSSMSLKEPASSIASCQSSCVAPSSLSMDIALLRFVLKRTSQAWSLMSSKSEFWDRFLLMLAFSLTNSRACATRCGATKSSPRDRGRIPDCHSNALSWSTVVQSARSLPPVSLGHNGHVLARRASPSLTQSVWKQ